VPRSHLTHLRLFSAFIDSCIREPYTLKRLSRDAIAGLTVGIIAIPLSMALAIASGVPPQHGLYTALIAGLLIALSGGSRYSVSGPTAAFVVILYPVSQQFGLGGLLIASVMAGLILLAMALARLGRFIEYIPEPVTLGFTSGIAIVIATLQLKDFFGLPISELPESYIEKAGLLLSSLPQLDLPNTGVALATLLVLLLWPRLRLPITGHLPAVLVGVVAVLLLGQAGIDVDTIGSRFSYLTADGILGHGIPPVLPKLMFPWSQPGPDGLPIEWSLTKIQALIGPAFSIAILGAIESLLCAVVLDGMTGRRHQANGELLGQGVGNLVAPFFGGITATAAIARSAANYRAGATSPISSVIHALVVGAGLVVLAPYLAYLPMASMAALLLVVAWNMSEAHKVVELLRKAPRNDILILLSCMSLTVLFDMVIAISFGIILAALLFMQDIANMTRVRDISGLRKQVPQPLPDGWAVYKITGSLFFAAADRVFSELAAMSEQQRGIILYMDGVTLLDAGGLSAFNRFRRLMAERHTMLWIADLQFQPLKTLAKAKVDPIEGQLLFFSTLGEAVDTLLASAPTSPR